ncbi:hypothetical protein ACET3Z_005110 [Daucus carota]
MKELSYDHLKLDNFTSFVSDIGSSTRIARLRSGFEKELRENRNEINKENGNRENIVQDDDLIYDGELLHDSDSDEEGEIFCEDDMVTSEGYCTLGPPTAKCLKCNALMWKEERINKIVKKRNS